QSTDRFSPLSVEAAHPYPDRTATSYPYAYEMVAQVFDSPAAPDVMCMHTSAHNWEDHGGERGEHGSMGVVQARAPFILAGAGVQAHGLMPRSCRLVDVAPTVLALMGAAPHPAGVGLNGRLRPDALLRRQDGEVLADLIDDRQPAPDHVVGFLLDGCNPNVLYDAVANGEAPNVARLMAMGTPSPTGRCRRCPRSRSPTTPASSPAATPATTACSTTPGTTGRRATGDHQLAGHVAVVHGHPPPDVETIYQAVKRTWPDAFTLAANSPATPGPVSRPSTCCGRASCPSGPREPATCPSPPTGSYAPRSPTRCRRE
ncbi:MAG: hypothetical protein WKF43_06770, partial [Acidimicrobiales bacterium]